MITFKQAKNKDLSGELLYLQKEIKRDITQLLSYYENNIIFTIVLADDLKSLDLFIICYNEHEEGIVEQINKQDFSWYLIPGEWSFGYNVKQRTQSEKILGQI